MERKLSFTAVNANNGEVISFDETLEKDDLIKGLMGSTAMPFVFPSIPYKGKVLIDGGSAWNLDVASAIKRCYELVDHESQIVVDIIDVGRNETVIPHMNHSGNAIHYYMRMREIKSFYQDMNDML